MSALKKVLAFVIHQRTEGLLSRNTPSWALSEFYSVTLNLAMAYHEVLFNLKRLQRQEGKITTISFYKDYNINAKEN